jgi:hypothetical protein
MRYYSFMRVSPGNYAFNHHINEDIGIIKVRQLWQRFISCIFYGITGYRAILEFNSPFLDLEWMIAEPQIFNLIVYSSTRLMSSRSEASH